MVRQSPPQPLLALFVIGLALGAAGSWAAEAEPAASSPEGWHLVRPGENLHLLAARYLGEEARWPELWRWNPGVKDPHLLTPGERLRVSHQEGRAEPAARLDVVARAVEAKPEPQAWRKADAGVFLLERDGIRTHADSSAELAFSDGDRLRLGENALVFLHLERGRLRGQGSGGAAPPPEAGKPLRRAVEIVRGRADVDLSPRAGARRAAVELQVGAASARLSPSTDGTGSSRARQDEDGARLMVYGGVARVSAAGATVDVPSGSGTSVRPGAAPAPPEKLLAAPRLLEPTEGATVGFDGPSFTWAEAKSGGAVSYEIELCRDPRCGAIAVRAAALTGSRWVAPRLEPGRYFWRLTAKSASGLDGFPSPARPVEISAQADRAEPAVRVEISGRSIERQGGRVWSADSTVRLVASDEEGGSGLERVILEVDGRPVEEGTFVAPFASGSYRLSARAVDKAGNVGLAAPTDFEVDASAPEIRWEKLAAGAAAGRGLEAWTGRQSALEWRSVDPMWLGWKWSEPGRSLAALPLRFSGMNPKSEVLLVADRRLEFGGAVSLTLEAGEALRLTFSDPGVDLASAAVRRDPEQPADPALWFEARDAFGHETKLRVPLRWK